MSARSADEPDAMSQARTFGPPEAATRPRRARVSWDDVVDDWVRDGLITDPAEEARVRAL